MNEYYIQINLSGSKILGYPNFQIHSVLAKYNLLKL